MIDICIFNNSLLNIRTTINDFFVAESLFVRPIASGCAHVTRSWHKRSQAKSKLTKNEALTVKWLR